jgi:hypothetical protein
VSSGVEQRKLSHRLPLRFRCRVQDDCPKKLSPGIQRKREGGRDRLTVGERIADLRKRLPSYLPTTAVVREVLLTPTRLLVTTSTKSVPAAAKPHPTCIRNACVSDL